MSRITQANAVKLSALLVAMTLLVFASGCKHKPAIVQATPPPVVEKPAPPPPPPPAKPSVGSFTVEPSSIEKGQSATLRWSAANATDLSIDQGIGAVQAEGQRQVFPSNTTTYTLTASGAGGTTSSSVTVTVNTPPPPPPPSLSAAELIARDLKDVFFDYDKSDIRDDARAALTADAEAFKKIFSTDSTVKVSVEGHSDERGSAEYNIALGDRRAAAAKDLLVQLGVPADRLTTISYGKEKPQCTDASEECYQKNRRAHFTAAQ